MELITLEDVTKTYHLGEQDLQVLKGVSMTVTRGELVALTGASGSGKSTLMNILGCLDRPTTGKYWLDGEEVSRFTADARALVRGRKIGFVFQNFNLLARTSALDNVRMPLTYAMPRPSDHTARQRAEAALQLVGLGDRMDHHPSQLSGGQQQRVAIARAIVTDPSFLLADEPTGDLDAKSAREILDLMGELHARQGKAIVMVTHDPHAAERADRLVHLEKGFLVADESRA